MQHSGTSSAGSLVQALGAATEKALSSILQLVRGTARRGFKEGPEPAYAPPPNLQQTT